jgi:hypothetical protein
MKSKMFVCVVTVMLILLISISLVSCKPDTSLFETEIASLKQEISEANQNIADLEDLSKTYEVEQFELNATIKKLSDDNSKLLASMEESKNVDTEWDRYVNLYFTGTMPEFSQASHQDFTYYFDMINKWVASASFMPMGKNDFNEFNDIAINSGYELITTIPSEYTMDGSNKMHPLTINKYKNSLDGSEFDIQLYEGPREAVVKSI